MSSPFATAISDATGEVIEWVSTFEITTALPYGAGVVGGVFAVRTLYCVIGRAVGISAPEHFSAFPRLPWRPAHTVWDGLRRLHERVRLFSRHGSTGGFASAWGTMSPLFRPGKLLLGRLSLFGLPGLQPVGITPRRHLFMLAQTGAGKTTALISILSCWRGSAFVIDPKSQIVNALRGHDKRRWFVINPGGDSDNFNVFDWIKECQARDGEDAAVLAAMRIAEALVITPPGNKSPIFYELPRQFLAGLILHVLTMHPPEHHNLPFVRDLIVHGLVVVGENGQPEDDQDDPHQTLLAVMSANPAFDGVVAGAASGMKSADSETLGNLRATLQEQTKWLDIPSVRAVMRTSDFSLADLKRRDDIVLAFTPSIYSVREELSRFSRLLTNVTAYTFEAEKSRKGLCLVVIDELPSQGYNPTIEVLLAVARSMGLLFLGISQSLELMQRHYPKAWKSFIGEADVVWWMGGTHPDNAKFLSQLLGMRTLIEKDRHTGRRTHREVPVMTPDQVTRHLDPNSDHLIVTRAGGRALRLYNEPYFKALPVWRYAPDPDHKEALLRRMVRALLRAGRSRSAQHTSTPKETRDD